VRGKKVISPEVLDELEEILIGADIGVRTTLELIEKIRTQVDRKLLNDTDELKRVLRQELLALLKAPAKSISGRAVRSELDIPADIRPYVIMVVGVNGVGKTTTIAKLAYLIKREGNEVIVCAADTFRAAAADQLTIWAERVGIPVIQQKPGTDPAAVVYDALQAAKSRQADVVIVDTAGRLHNKVNLMNELEKMSRIARREVPQAPHEVLLVLDAATGQNGLEQARQFARGLCGQPVRVRLLRGLVQCFLTAFLRSGDKECHFLAPVRHSVGRWLSELLRCVQPPVELRQQ
jgi:fused signal recognition particle receptor